MPRRLRLVLLAALLAFSVDSPTGHAQFTDPSKAAAYRKGNQPVEPVSDTTIIAEAEEFQGGAPGWKAKPWGENYYAGTFANSFLSRKAYLGAPEQCERSVASITVRVPKSGRYLALVRYEAPYRFEAQFRLQVEQGGKVKLDRLYGARDNLKIWAFREKLKKELSWSWGAVENVVWEGHDAAVQLDAGPAKLSLIADKQPGNAAHRNVDLVLLTSDEKQVKDRIEKENYLPLDGMLTQAGDVYLKVHNAKDAGKLALTVPNGTEHSPYWVHLRDWKPKTITTEPGQSTDWIEVGSLLDSLNDGQWNITAKGSGSVRYALEFGVRNADGKIDSFRKLDGLTGNVALAYDADTRYSRRIRTDYEVLGELVDALKKGPPVHGTPPKRTIVYGYTFTPKEGDAKYNALIAEFAKLTGANGLAIGTRNEIPDDPPVRGYTDLRSVPTPKLEDACKKLQAEGKANKIAVVSLGDEIGLGQPPANDHEGFRAWLKSQKRKPSDLDPAFGEDWSKVTYNPTPAAAKSNPGVYYYSRLYANRFGIRQLKERTDILRKYLPNAGIGANFSPHHNHLYIGSTAQWISLFREGGMTMPWGEDYIWQVPVGSQQMSALMLDMFRSGVRGKPEAKIHFYVMPHWPGNTPNSWRRQFYGDLAHGAKVLNLFEFRPVQAAYTENHASSPAMYQEVRRSLHELGTFEDVIQDGTVRPGVAGLWFSEAGDVWDDLRHPFDVAKRSLYVAIRHQQLPLDAVVEGDDLKPYRVLYLTDGHVSRAAAKAIAGWVKGGGKLFATAGAGMFDEFDRPNTILRELLGVEQQSLQEAAGEPIRFEKQDLPFAKPLTTATLADGKGKERAVPVLGLRSKFTVKGATPIAKFADGSPAVAERQVDKGTAYYCGFLPGLSYFQPAIPLRPMDRGTTDDSMGHFIPTQFDPAVSALIAKPATDVQRPVVCSEPLVETTIVESKSGVVVPLVNWSKGPVKGLTVTLNANVPTGKVTRASGKPVKVAGKVITLDLDVADALILRP